MTEHSVRRSVRQIGLAAALVVAMLMVLLARPATALAGSISLVQHDPSNNPIGGGRAAVYQVGTISGSSYYYVAPFSAIGDDLTSHITEHVDLTYLAQLERIATQSGTPLQEGEIGSDGVIKFSNLEPGAYLVVQTEPAEGYNSFDRFLVTIPWQGKYDVEASPKLDPVHPGGNSNENGNTNENENTNENRNTNQNENTNENKNQNGNENTNENRNTNDNENGNTNTPGNGNTNTPNGGTGGGGSDGGSGGSSGGSSTVRLPQTGQLWWPVWVLLVAGGSFVVAGLVWRDRHRPLGDEQE